MAENKGLIDFYNELGAMPGAPGFENVPKRSEAGFLTNLRRTLGFYTAEEHQLHEAQKIAQQVYAHKQLSDIQRTVPGGNFLLPAQPATLGAPPVQTLGLAPGALAGPQALGGPLTLPPRTGGFSPVLPQLVTNPPPSPFPGEGPPGLVPRMSQAVLSQPALPPRMTTAVGEVPIPESFANVLGGMRFTPQEAAAIGGVGLPAQIEASKEKRPTIHTIAEGGTLAIVDKDGNIVKTIQNPQGSFKHLGTDLPGIMIANGLDPSVPEDVAKGRELMKQEKEATQLKQEQGHIGMRAQNAAMEVVTKGAVKEFEKGTYQQKAAAMKYQAELSPSARIELTQTAANREVIPPQYANLHGEDYLKTLPVGKANEVRAMLNFQLDPTRLASMRTGAREELLQHALQVDPSFRMTTYPAQQKLVNEFTSGKVAQNRVAIGQAINHIGTLLDLSTELKNGNVLAANAFVNYVRTQMGHPEVNNLVVAQQAVGTELMRVFRQVQASEKESAEWQARYKPSSSPTQFIGAGQTAVKLLAGRLSELNNLWNSGMGVTTGFPNIVSPAAQAVLNKFGFSITGPAPQSDILSQADAILKGK